MCCAHGSSPPKRSRLKPQLLRKNIIMQKKNVTLQNIQDKIEDTFCNGVIDCSDKGIAVHTRHKVSATATGLNSIAATTGDNTAVIAEGKNSIAIANGNYAGVVNSGNNSLAISNGIEADVIANGDHSIALGRNRSNVSVTGNESIAIGIDSFVEGELDTILICIKTNQDGSIKMYQIGTVDLINILPKVRYTIEENKYGIVKFIPAE